MLAVTLLRTLSLLDLHVSAKFKLLMLSVLLNLSILRSTLKAQVSFLMKKIAELVREHFDLRPAGIIKMLDLQRPIYSKTAAYGHFGREEPNSHGNVPTRLQN